MPQLLEGFGVQPQRISQLFPLTHYRNFQDKKHQPRSAPIPEPRRHEGRFIEQFSSPLLYKIITNKKADFLMRNSIPAVAAKIRTCLAAVAAEGLGSFVVGRNTVVIDQRGISINLHDEDGSPVALRLHRPNIDVTCWGYVLAGKPGEVDATALEDNMRGYEVIASLPKLP